MLTASMLYAKNHARECQGAHVCHWCGAGCGRQWNHGDDPPIPFTRSRSSAKFPHEAWQCVGCWLYRRPSITVVSLGGVIQDRKSLKDFSWVMTEAETKVILPGDSQRAYDFLLSPSLTFSLSLLDRDGNHNGSLIQLAVVNKHESIRGDTPLGFTLNNQPYEYTVYELEEALKHGLDGKSGGVRTLVGILGKCEKIEPVTPFDEEVRGRGRPKKNDGDPRKKIR